jgi:hypothetical protein
MLKIVWLVQFTSLRKDKDLLIFNELFAIGKSTICSLFCEVVYAIYVVYMHATHWPISLKLQMVMVQFKMWCGLPCVQGMINEIHIAITKASSAFENICYYLKTCGRNIVTQVVIDCNKMFMDVFVGLFGSMNDS